MMAFDNSYTAVTGATYQASDYNTHTKGNFTAVWVGTTVGDLDYYTSATAKNRLALVAGGMLYGGASAPAWLAKPASLGLLKNDAAGVPSYLIGGSAFQHLRKNAGNTDFEWAELVYRRQGGNASNWQTGGTTAYTPTGSVRQKGVINITTNSSGIGSATVTYPVAFAQRPIVLAIVGGNTGGNVILTFSDDLVSGCTFHVFKTDLGVVTVQVNWEAEGPL